MLKVWIAMGAGFLIGIFVTGLVASLWSASSRELVFNGVGWGFGGGFGAVAAILTLNKLVGYLDRVVSGKA